MAGCKKEQESLEQPETEQQEGQNSAGQEQPAENSEDDMQDQESVSRDLTNEELREFTRWINQGSNYGNYGFLLSEYTRPQERLFRESGVWMI